MEPNKLEDESDELEESYESIEDPHDYARRALIAWGRGRMVPAYPQHRWFAWLRSCTRARCDSSDSSNSGDSSPILLESSRE
jgi:hypothetical protein